MDYEHVHKELNRTGVTLRLLWDEYKEEIPAGRIPVSYSKFTKGYHDLPVINHVVDIYNLVFMESKFALGAYDLDKVDGAITLRFTDGGERFVPIGQEEPIPVEKGYPCLPVFPLPPQRPAPARVRHLPPSPTTTCSSATSSR